MPMASNQPKQFINTLSDNIRKRGAMDTLISDGGKYEISKRVTDLLRSLFIQDYQSEPYHQHQNKAENRFGLAKCYTNTVMNTSGCPACCWLLCLQYICVVLNHLASPTLQGICPVQALQGTTPDVSFMLHFSFYEPVYYRIDSSEPDLNFPSSSNEKKGYWVSFADNQGDNFTWRILTEDTQKIIIRSGVRSALRTTTNQCLASPSANKSSSTRWRIASLKRHYHVTSIVKVQSKKSEDPNSVGSSDPINVNICVKPIMGSYVQLPNALSVAAHLGTILGLIALPNGLCSMGVSVSSDVPFGNVWD